MLLTINDTPYLHVKSREALRGILWHSRQQPAEIWLDFDNNAEGDRPALNLLTNGDVCWLMYLRYRGDNGFSTYQTRQADNIAEITFQLANGDTFITAASNCPDWETGCDVLVYFLETNGERARWVNWQAD